MDRKPSRWLESRSRAPRCSPARHAENYAGVLKVDGGIAEKKVYDPRSWGKSAKPGMAARVVKACEELRTAGNPLK